jgi:hypothetical protein
MGGKEHLEFVASVRGLGAASAAAIHKQLAEVGLLEKVAALAAKPRG